MRIVAISDSHGANKPVEDVIFEQTEAKNVFFLGDGIRHLEHLPDMFPDKQFFFVEGNCDFWSLHKTSDMVVLGGKKIFFTHGHEYNVKYGTKSLESAARSRFADIVLYGHTHIPDITYRDGLYIINPGSIARGRSGRNSYAIIDITDAGIVPNIIFL
ncbi:MAG TPA: metallophosphoesterase [Clostridiales bacterium]|nr:metallophosphoesterase [Clostridiales bacterium]